MQKNANDFLKEYEKYEKSFQKEDLKKEFDLAELENQLEAEVDKSLADIEFLESERKSIGNPDALGEVIKKTILEQVNMQLGIVGGEEFIDENRGMTFDPRSSAHIQTTENFKEGKIAKHNTEINYQERYDHWQNNFQKDENGNILTHTTRTGRQEATLKKGARTPFDKDRPSGSKENGTDMDHTVSAGEIIRDPEANAHLSKDEQIQFANSKENLNEIDSNLNRSKKDLPMEEWLDTPNSKGQKPNEIFDISKEKDWKLRQKDEEARTEYEKVKNQGKERSIKTGRASQQNEISRFGAKAVSVAIRSLLVALLRDVIGGFVSWLKSSSKSIKTFLESAKISIQKFVTSIKEHMTNAAEATGMAIVTMIFTPIAKLIRNVFMIVKQGVKSIKSAISYIRDPENRKKPISIMALEIGKIVMSGLTVVGAFFLSEAIEKGLIALAPAFFNFQIPLLGSIGSIIGVFISSLVAGIIGAIVLNLIDKLIANKRENEILKEKIKAQNETLEKQNVLVAVKEMTTNNTAHKTGENIRDRHEESTKVATSIMLEAKVTSDKTAKNVCEVEKKMNEVEHNHKIAKLFDSQQESDDSYDDLMNKLSNM
ncbi:MAG: hypothetical protein IKP49_04200 [Treponema sp.]|nr:hypothetical protein [Treponema sp.]